MAKPTKSFKLPISIQGADLIMNESEATIRTVGREAPIGSIFVGTGGSIFQKVGPVDTDWKDFIELIAEARGDYDPGGFPDRDGSSLSYNEVTREATLSVPVEQKILVKGKRITLTSDLVLSHPDVTGMYFFYIDSDGAMQVTNAFNQETLIYQNAYVANVYWNSTQQKAVFGIGDERHGLMDPHTHFVLHEILGSQWISGMTIGNFDAGNATADSGAQFSVSSGVLRDEDIELAVAAVSSTGVKRVLYRVGATEWRVKSTLDSFPVMQAALPECPGVERIHYNPRSLGISSLAEVPNGDFVSCFVVASNAGEFFYVVGQMTYANEPEAKDNIRQEWNSMVLDGFPAQEYKLVGVVLYETKNSFSNSIKARVVQLDSDGIYLDTRTEATGRSLTVDSHANLPGLNNGQYGDGGHTNLIPVAYAIVDPTVNDDVDLYKVGTLWVNTITKETFTCVDNSNGAAVWKSVYSYGTWQASKKYVVGDVVKYRGGQFRVITSHTSGTAFLDNPDKVEPITSGILLINAAAHGFVAKDVLYHNGAAWGKARANVSSTLSDPPAIVVDSETDWFLMASGVRFVEIPLHGLTLGSIYYLSDATAGALTSTEPSPFSNPIVRAISNDVVAVLTYRPTETV